MSEILKKVSQNTINSYIEKNLDDFYTKSSAHSNFNSHIEKKISWVLAKEVDWPECIFRADLENLSTQYEITAVKKLIQEGKAPNGWTVGPLTTPKNLGSILEKFGFSKLFPPSSLIAKQVSP